MVKTAKEFYDEHYSDDTIVMMRDFAKFHVKEALQAAEEIAIEFDSEGNYDNSILNAYPIENIK